MNIQGSTAKYVELSNQAYGVIVDTFASAMRSRLDFWKSVWQIASRPYASTAIASIMGENFDRASELTNLTVGELQARVQARLISPRSFLPTSENCRMQPLRRIAMFQPWAESKMRPRKCRATAFQP